MEQSDQIQLLEAGCVDPSSVPGFGIFTLTLIVPADLPEGKAGRPLP